MAESLRSRMKRAWGVFFNKDPTVDENNDPGYYYRPDRPRLTRGNERSIITSIYNRIAIDAAAVEIRHVRTDENGKYLEDICDDLHRCLTVEANIDQSASAFMIDVVISLLDEGNIAIVPIDNTLRTGKITQWYPYSVEVELYNETVGEKQRVRIDKQNIAIVENPFYAIMNEPNSTLQRLVRKLNLLDAVDEQSSSGKLDIIIQLPYAIRGELKEREAEKRLNSIQRQLTGSRYGIAYIDQTEHITQLNRASENNLLTQVEYLTNMLYGQLGITPEILNGSANEETMLNYTKRTIEPIVGAIVDEMKRKFLTQTARSQHQSIMFFSDPFKLMPISEVGNVADKLTRNEILSSNEFRGILGYKPSEDPRADQLLNKNMKFNNDPQQNPFGGNGYQINYEGEGFDNEN